MSIAVVIPAYNAERYLMSAIESVLAQTVSDWELVIVNDGSQDSTASIAARHTAQDRRIKLVDQENRGVASARNAGFAYLSSKAEYVCFLDADDSLEPAALGLLKKALDYHQHIVAAHGKPRYVDNDGGPAEFPPVHKQVAERSAFVENGIVSCSAAPLTTFEMLIVANCIITPGACLIRRSDIDSVGLFDKEMQSCEDWDLWIRLSRRGPIAYVDEIVVAYRRHPDSVSSNKERHHMAGERVRRKATFSPENNPKQAKIARTVYDQLSSDEYELRLKWAREAFFQGNILGAAKQVRHASLARARSRQISSNGL